MGILSRPPNVFFYYAFIIFYSVILSNNTLAIIKTGLIIVIYQNVTAIRNITKI